MICHPALPKAFTASLPEIFPSRPMRARRNCRQTATTTGGPSDPIAFMAFWSSARNQAVIASLMFSSASFSSRPCDTHPGSAGHCATIQPSSAFSSDTWKRYMEDHGRTFLISVGRSTAPPFSRHIRARSRSGSSSFASLRFLYVATSYLITPFGYPPPNKPLINLLDKLTG